MAKHDRELLRPEDATSWEEFQARCTIEQAQCRAANSSWKSIGQTVLVAPIAFVDIFCWFLASLARTGGGVAAGVAAGVIFALLALWIFGKVMRRGFGGSKRYMELSRLRKEWQAKAEHGEIPQTTPGGPKVWRDELETEARGT